MEPTEERPRVISRAQAIEMLEVSESTFHRWAADNPQWKASDVARPGAWYLEDEIRKVMPPVSGS